MYQIWNMISVVFISFLTLYVPNFFAETYTNKDNYGITFTEDTFLQLL